MRRAVAVAGNRVTDPTAVPGANPGLGDPNAARRPSSCARSEGNLTVRGSIEATFNSGGSPRTVNIVPLEQYVAGWSPTSRRPDGARWAEPVPRASPGDSRSSRPRRLPPAPTSWPGWGPTGATPTPAISTCQTYRGTLNENAITDLAVTDTAGQVMEFPGGAVAATQYSASTGGYTDAGGVPGGARHR